jgi:hypothetical protein
MLLYLTFPKSSYNKVNGNGTMIANEEFIGDGAVLTVENTRCSLDMKTCTKLPVLKFRDMCNKISDKGAFYYTALEKISPQLSCPIKPGNYTIPPCTVDMSVIGMMNSFEGFAFFSTLKLVLNDPATRTKKMIGCAQFEVKITKVTKTKS